MTREKSDYNNTNHAPFVAMAGKRTRSSPRIAKEPGLGRDGGGHKRRKLRHLSNDEAVGDADAQRHRLKTDSAVISTTREGDPSSEAAVRRSTKRRKGYGWTKRRPLKEWAARAILDEDDTQYLIAYEPVREGAESEISWQPKSNANEPLVADWRDRRIQHVKIDGSSQRDNVSRLRLEAREASDCDIVSGPREMTSDPGEREYLQHSSQSALPMDFDRKETVSDPRQPNLGSDDVTETRIGDYAEDLDVILPEAVNSYSAETSRVHEPISATRDAYVFDLSNSKRSVAASENRAADQARSCPRRGMSISALLIPENSPDSSNNGTIEPRLPGKGEPNGQMESMVSNNTQNSGREVGGNVTASWGKLVSARLQLRQLLATQPPAISLIDVDV